MKPWMLLVAVLLGGCEAHDRDALIDQGKDAASAAWGRAAESARKLGSDASESALQAAKARLEEAKSRIGKAQAPSAEKVQSEIQAQIDRIDAAQSLHNLQEELGARIDEAQKWKDETGVRYARAKAEVEQIRRKVDEAKLAYEDAAKKARSAADAVRDFSNP